MNIEGTPEAQRRFDALTSPCVEGRDASPYEPPTMRMTRHIMQQIVAESPYKPDMEWDLWHQAHELEEHNHLPEGVTAEDVYQCYLRVFHHE